MSEFDIVEAHGGTGYGTLRIITNTILAQPGDDVYVDESKIGIVESWELDTEKTTITIQITDFHVMDSLITKNAQGERLAFSFSCSKCGRPLDFKKETVKMK